MNIWLVIVNYKQKKSIQCRISTEISWYFLTPLSNTDIRLLLCSTSDQHNTVKYSQLTCQSVVNFITSVWHPHTTVGPAYRQYLWRNTRCCSCWHVALTHDWTHIHTVLQQLVPQALVGQHGHVQLLQQNLVRFPGGFLQENEGTRSAGWFCVSRAQIQVCVTGFWPQGSVNRKWLQKTRLTHNCCRCVCVGVCLHNIS